LPEIGFVVVENNANGDCEYFSGGDDEGYEMLFELFDHAIDEHLTDCAEDAHDEHVQEEYFVSEDEGAHVDELEQAGGVDY
jgi:hypothetical protein